MVCTIPGGFDNPPRRYPSGAQLRLGCTPTGAFWASIDACLLATNYGIPGSRRRAHAPPILALSGDNTRIAQNKVRQQLAN
jgi:hypothetical protein